MVQIYINDSLMDLSEEFVLSYNYELYSDPLSAFTSVYSSTVDFPLTPNNSKAFNYPELSYSSMSAYTYRVFSDYALVDFGACVVAYVNNTSVSCNFYSSLIKVADYLNKIQDFGQCVGDSCKYLTDQDTEAVCTIGSDVDYTLTASKLITAFNEYLYLVGDGSYNTNGLLFFSAANIGKPTNISCSSYYDGTAVASFSDGVERTYLQTGLSGNAAQLRTYDLQPLMQTYTLFESVLKKGVDVGVAFTISPAVRELLYKYYITTPSFREFFSGTNLEYVAPTTSTVSATTVTVTPSDGCVTMSSLLTPQSGGHGVLYTSYGAARFVTGNLFTISYNQGTASTVKFFMYPSQETECCKRVYRTIFNDSTITKVPIGDINNASIVLSGLADIATTFTISCEGYAHMHFFNTGGSTRALSGDVVTGHAPGVATIQLNPGSEPTVYTRYAVYGSYSTNTLGGDKFNIREYIATIANPWQLVTDICKQFNLRFKITDSENIVLVRGVDYYDAIQTDLTSYVDWTEYSVSPQVFDYNKVVFEPSLVASSWNTFHESTYNEPYGVGRLTTNYPVDSSSSWFSFNVLKHLVTFPKYNFYGWNGTTWTPCTIYNASQAYDTDYKQIQIPYCLVYCDNDQRSYSTYVCDEVQSSDACWYTQSYITTLISGGKAAVFPSFKYISTLYNSGNVYWKEQCLFGLSSASPESLEPSTIVTDYFKDVIDQAQSSKVEVGVFINKLNTTLYKFVNGVYYFDNALWIVQNVTGYNIVGDAPTHVEFIKIQDIENY